MVWKPEKYVGKYLIIFILAALIIWPSYADAHRSGCHRWHSCPSDRGTYTCGDTGHCSGCPDNQYCESGQPSRPKIIKKEIPPPLQFEYKPEQKPMINYTEADYRDFACQEFKGIAAYNLGDGLTVDCITSDYVLEFEFEKNWADAIGKALFYEIKTGRKAGIVLIVEKYENNDDLKKIKQVIREKNLEIKLWTILREALSSQK